MEENAKTSESEANTFAELGLNEWLVNQCTAVGMIKPTPIQRNCVPKIIEGENVCVGDNMETFRCACMWWGVHAGRTTVNKIPNVDLFGDGIDLLFSDLIRNRPLRAVKLLTYLMGNTPGLGQSHD